MTIGMILCGISLLISAGLVFLSVLYKNKIFSLILNHTILKKSVPDICSSIINSYGINTDEKAEEVNNDDINDADEISEDEETEEDDISDDNTGGRKYEEISDNIIVDIKEETESKKVPYVHLADGTETYYAVGGDSDEFGVYFSEDLYNSDSVVSAALAGYETTKLCESINKPFWATILSTISIVPKALSQISWILCGLGLVGVFGPASMITIIISVASVILTALSVLDWFYYSYIAGTATKNLLDLGLIDKTEKQWCLNIMNKVSLIDATKYMKAFRWFLNKILGYRV